MTHNWWLLLQKSDETRISLGIDAYNDITGKMYQYDDHVPNHKNLKTGDYIVLRKENEILGYGYIGKIKTDENRTKTHRRCPSCNQTDIRERRTKTPK